MTLHKKNDSTAQGEMATNEIESSSKRLKIASRETNHESIDKTPSDSSIDWISEPEERAVSFMHTASNSRVGTRMVLILQKISLFVFGEGSLFSISELPVAERM